MRKEEIRAAASGSAQPIMNKSSFSRLSIYMPPLGKQHAIASVLGALDDKIELSRRINETLEAMAQAIFKDWFVNFGPTRAKAEDRPPYLAPDTWDLFPDALDNDDKPLGWEFKLIGQLVEFNPSESLSKGSEAPYLDMAALPTQGSWPEPPIQRPFGSGSKFRDGDTLLARITPCLENGKTAFVQCLGKGIVGWGSTEFIVLRPKQPFPAEYGYLLARDEGFRDRAIQSMTGTSGRQRVQTDSLAGYEVILPDDPVLRAFGNLVHPWFAMIRANAAQSQTLGELRDLLLPKLMSGEIRLREGEKVVEAVA